MNAALANSQTAGRVLVYGLGNTGLSVARFLAREDVAGVFADTRAAAPGVDELRRIVPDVQPVLGRPEPALLDGIARVVASPGIADRDPLLVAARERGIEVVSDIQLFVEHAQAPFVAVTGSNGKSTVTTLLGRMCAEAGRRAYTGANLGEPALDLLAKERPELYVLELSSFQLQRTRDLPARVAVLLNISADHLDWHRDEAEYREAKYRILREADAVVINRADPAMREQVPAGCTCRSFALDAPRRQNWGLVSRDGEEWLACGEDAVMLASALRLVGRHNLENALAALAAGELLGLERAAMCRALADFTGLPHRMQFVRELDGVIYVDDSKATNVAAAIASVQSLSGSVVLIAGGQGKGGDFAALADAVAPCLRAAVLIGEDAPAIERAFAGRVPITHAATMQQAVSAARAAARAGDTVLLAPACASFDQFANYGARGDAFAAAAGELTA